MTLNSKVALLIAIFIVVPLAYTPLVQLHVGVALLPNDLAISSIPEQIQNSKSESQNMLPKHVSSSVSQVTPETPETSGIMNSKTVEQVGYYNPGDYPAQTDTGLNCIKEFPIDVGHNWKASSADINVWNLNRLYAVNSSLDEGYPGTNIAPSGNVSYHPLGWDSNSTTTDTSTNQTSSYVDTGRSYVVVENQGKTLGTGSNERTLHAAGTEILWTQVIDNAPESDNFVFSTDFLYKSGPINPSLGSSITLMARIDGIEIWSASLAALAAHEIWYSTGNISVTVPGVGSSFLFEVGLKINVTLSLYHNAYDILDAHYITAYLDDISLTGITSPDFESVNLEFHVGSQSVPISGSAGVGSASILNPSYWNQASVTVSVLSNVSVSFEYDARMRNHRFLNSSWTNDITKQGVYYSITSGNTSELDMYTYLAFIGVYEDLQLRIYHPTDWSDFKVFDPFFNDVTANCTFTANYIEVPTIVLDVLGWWQIHCQSPNYAHDAFIEKYDSGISAWVNNTVFHSDDDARLSVAIQSGSNVPLLSTPVTFTWVLANCTTWYESWTTSGLLGTAVSSSITFGPTNTTAGYWGVIYHWTNGTEIAYGCVRFSLHHQAVLQFVPLENLETVVGQPVTILIRFYDTENGMFLLNNDVEINGTWSGGVVQFEPNIVKNWWQADFDTALVGAGSFNVTIVSNSEFFETHALVLTIKSEYLTSLDAPGGPLEPLVYGRAYTYDYVYTTDYDGLGIEGATVQAFENGSDWISVTEIGNGHYNLTLSPLGLQYYNIRIVFSKVGYQNQTNYLNFLVKRVPIKVAFLSGLSGPELKSSEIKVEITEADTNRPITDANVTLNVLSSVGILYASETMIEETPGIYQVTIIMPKAGEITYNAIVYVEKPNYELTQTFSSTLVPSFNPGPVFINTVIKYSPQILFMIGVVGSVVVGQKYYSRKRRAKQAKARAIKARFSDANNLLGIIVLHKMSGIPIYSKILKGGLEEGMLSAFISAIMHFRSEFETAGSTGEYKIIPISDIVRAVPTENLICAFITITSASPEQEVRMISFARAIGMMFDDVLSQQPSKVADTKTVKTLEWLFDDFVDGSLLREYQLGEKSLPKDLQCIEDAVTKGRKENAFKLVNIIRLLESCGIYEDDAYIIVMDAIENEYITPVYNYNGPFDNSELKS